MEPIRQRAWRGEAEGLARHRVDRGRTLAVTGCVALGGRPVVALVAHPAWPPSDAEFGLAFLPLAGHRTLWTDGAAVKAGDQSLAAAAWAVVLGPRGPPQVGDGQR